MDDDVPPLTLGADNSDRDLAKAEALRALYWPTRATAANILRVMRGAGRPQDLPQQIIDLAQAILEANDLSNAWGIWSEMERCLQSAVPQYADLDDFDDHRPAIVRGSLQVCASNLVGQMSQMNAGSR